MTTSWGIDPLKSGGVVTQGMTSADIRQVQGGLYTPGLISGGIVTRSASALTYTVSAGVAAFPIVTGTTPQTVLGPIPSGTLTTTAPASGTRQDYIYAQQRTIADNGDPQIVLAIGTTVPARAVMLNGFIVSSTNTNTNATVPNRNIIYSIPYGASLGLFVNKRSTFTGAFTVRATDITETFFTPTDRLIRVSLIGACSSNTAVGFDNAKYCEAAYDIKIDGVLRFTWSTPGLHQAWSENHWSDTYVLGAGTHTITTERFRVVGPGTPVARGSALLTVEDIGPVA